MTDKPMMMSKGKINWTVAEVLKELKTLGSEQTKKIYIRHGAREPLFGITTKDLKTVMKKTGKNYELAMGLFASGNYDAMYFAGMITEPQNMSKADFELWIQSAYCQGIADFTVAVSLAETTFADELADQWIQQTDCIYRSAGWSCYCWLLGNRPDTYFKKQQIKDKLTFISEHIHQEVDCVKYAMNSFVIAVGISYLPLHEYAYELAKRIGVITVDMGDTSCKTPNAEAYIEQAKNAKRLGFKRKRVRC